MTVIYHGTPMTPRAALEAVGPGRAFCVSFFNSQDVEVVQEISPAVMFRQRCVFGMESGHKARRALVYSRELDALLSMAGATFVSSGALGSDTRCTRCAEPTQRFATAGMAVWSEGRAALAYGRSDRTAVATLRTVRPSLLGLDRAGDDTRHAGVSRPHGGSCSCFGQPLAGVAHDARHGSCSSLPVSQRGQHFAGAERMAL